MEAFFVKMVFAAELYLISGLIFSVSFIIWGLTSVDSHAKNTGLIFKILIIPGLVVLWPIIVLKWNI